MKKKFFSIMIDLTVLVLSLVVFFKLGPFSNAALFLLLIYSLFMVAAQGFCLLIFGDKDYRKLFKDWEPPSKLRNWTEVTLWFGAALFVASAGHFITAVSILAVLVLNRLLCWTELTRRKEEKEEKSS